MLYNLMVDKHNFQFQINCIYVVEPLANTNNNKRLMFLLLYFTGWALLWVCLSKNNAMKVLSRLQT